MERKAFRNLPNSLTEGGKNWAGTYKETGEKINHLEEKKIGTLNRDSIPLW